MYCLESECKLNREIDQAISIICDAYYRKDLKGNKISSFSLEESSVYTGNSMMYNSFVTDGSSMDQVFNVGLNGCSDITVIDSCPFLKHYYYFKVAALLGLNSLQFEKFLNNDGQILNEAFLDKGIFERIKPILLNLNPESYRFWCTIYDKIGNTRVIGNLFNEGKGSLNIHFANGYLNNSKNYILLRERIRFIKPKFINDNILNIEKYLKLQNVDFLNICNVYDQVKDNRLQLQKLIQVINGFKKIISDEGKMIIYYNSCQMNRNLMSLINLGKIITPKDNVELKDDYVVYKKTK